MGEVRVGRYNPRLFVPDQVIGLVGKRNSGKSTIMSEVLVHILNAINKESKDALGNTESTIWSATELSNEFWQFRSPLSFIHAEFDAGRFKLIWARQKRRWAKWKAGGSVGPKPRAIFILEDMAHDIGAIQKNKEFLDVVLNGRHSGVTLFIVTQYMMVLNRTVRSNLDKVICTKEINGGNVKRIYDEWGQSYVDNIRTFKPVFEQATSDFSVLIFDATNGTMKWFKGLPNREFTMGSTAQWAHHNGQLRLAGKKEKSKKPSSGSDSDSDSDSDSNSGSDSDSNSGSDPDSNSGADAVVVAEVTEVAEAVVPDAAGAAAAEAAAAEAAVEVMDVHAVRAQIRREMQRAERKREAERTALLFGIFVDTGRAPEITPGSLA